jgi:hypothetical protein
MQRSGKPPASKHFCTSKNSTWKERKKKHENLEVNPEHMNKIIFEERKP